MSFSAPFLCTFWFFIRRGVGGVVLLMLCAAGAAQTSASSSDYTTALPSVQRVESAMQGTDATDTAARQVAVFEYLQVYIRRIRDTRSYSGPFLPGELKMINEYSKAQYDVTQSFTKSHTPKEVTRFKHLEGQYSVNNALDWIKQLEGKQAADTYAGTQATLAQSYKQHEAQLQQQMNPQQQQQANGQTGGGLLGGNSGPVKLNDEQKRCLELGGTMNECANGMVGLVKDLGSLISMVATDESSQQPPLSGVILVGKYHSRTELPEFMLEVNGTATLQKCGTLVDLTQPYRVRRSSAGTQIVVDNEPDPIVLTLRSDGSLSGPGNVTVKGSIIIGSHNVTACRTGSINANCSTTSTPIYGPSMQRCTIGQMAPQPAPPPPPKPTGMIGEVADLFGAGDSVATVYGLRMIGPYASSNGMLLDFNNGYVTVDCGKAHVNAPYTVENTANGFVIHVQNGGGAFLLGVAPDTTLRGSGSTTVNGRLVSAVNGENVSFTPHSESCNVGTFAPKGKQNTMVASNGAAPVVPASYATSAEAAAVPDAAALGTSDAGSGSIANSLAGAGIASATSGERAQFRVLLSSSFSGINPLAGQPVFVSRKPMDRILRELGVTVPERATPARAMKALQTQCHSTQGCSAVMQGLPKYYVTTTKLDASGKATLAATATTGQYYFFAIVPSAAGGSLVWDVPANLAAGDNNVVFNQANAERVQ